MVTRGSGENARISGNASRSVQRANLHMGTTASRSVETTTISWLVLFLVNLHNIHSPTREFFRNHLAALRKIFSLYGEKKEKKIKNQSLSFSEKNIFLENFHFCGAICSRQLLHPHAQNISEMISVPKN